MSELLPAPLIDLRPDHWAIVRDILQRCVPEREVWAFGSRARWTAKQYSDLDLAVIGDQPLTLAEMTALSDAFTESDLPFKVDVVDWATTEDNFRRIIRNDKVVVQQGTGGEWVTHRISALIDGGKLLIGDGYRAKNNELGVFGIPFARAGNINNGFIFEDADKFPKENIRKIGKKFSQPGDVVFTSKGTVGRFAFVKPETPRFVYSPQLCFWRSLDNFLLDGHYLFFWMHDREFFVQFKGVAGQTDMAEYVSLTDQRRMQITLPPFPEQRAIAHILGTLDDKIELNRKMAATLEAMARALFKSWFVDFDPVRAKAEGRETGLPPHIAKLFPDRLTETEEGGVPEGWKIGQLLDLCELKRGYDLPTARRIPGKHPIISSSGISGWHAESAVNGPGVITGRYGTIGQVFFIETPYWPLNTSLYVCDFKNNSPRLVYYILSQLDFMRYSDKAAVPGINRNHLHLAPIILPSRIVQDAFDRTLQPIWNRQQTLEAESQTLAALRDTLLPKLVSGSLRIKDAERFLEKRGLS